MQAGVQMYKYIYIYIHMHVYIYMYAHIYSTHTIEWESQPGTPEISLPNDPPFLYKMTRNHSLLRSTSPFYVADYSSRFWRLRLQYSRSHFEPCRSRERFAGTKRRGPGIRFRQTYCVWRHDTPQTMRGSPPANANGAKHTVLSAKTTGKQ